MGSALLYFTGSKAHNIALRQRAIERGWLLSEYGLFEEERLVASTTEEEIYEALGMQFVPPPLREGTGEVEAAVGGWSACSDRPGSDSGRPSLSLDPIRRRALDSGGDDRGRGGQRVSIRRLHRPRRGSGDQRLQPRGDAGAPGSDASASGGAPRAADPLRLRAQHRAQGRARLRPRLPPRVRLLRCLDPLPFRPVPVGADRPHPHRAGRPGGQCHRSSLRPLCRADVRGWSSTSTRCSRVLPSPGWRSRSTARSTGSMPRPR